MFCTTECWNCNDYSCKHFISKSSLYFENIQLQQRIDKAIEYVKNENLRIVDVSKEIPELCEKELLEILGEKK